MKRESLKMNLKSLKSQLNNQKGRFSNEKVTKSVSTFYKNKPNFSEDKFGTKHLSKRIYERFHPLARPKNKPNQTQFKPNGGTLCGFRKKVSRNR
ncbi:MAG: hypothetical protein ACFFCW_15630 [Candidatus Hodarchaeota archaeon]